MEECVACGRPAMGTGFVEGARVALCEDCARHASDFHAFPRPPSRASRAPRAQPQSIPQKPNKASVEFELVEDCARVIRAGIERKSKGDEDEERELGRFWREKKVSSETGISVAELIAFMEGRLKPTLEQAKRLEFALGCKLLEEAEAETAGGKKIDLSALASESRSRGGMPTTLADIVEVKKKK